MQIIQVKRNQTLFDIALEQYGNVEAVVWLVEDNQLNGVTDNIWEGQELKLRAAVMNQRMVNYLKKYTVATREGVIAEGIGFWEIERDFVVS